MAFKEAITAPTNSKSSAEIQEEGDGLKSLFSKLKDAVDNAYASGVTIQEAEGLAAMTISAQLDIAAELASVDLDSRMKKNGVKGAKAQAYMEEINKHDKKPAEGYLDNAVLLHPLVNQQADSFERADARKEELTIYLSIFKDAHIYFRGISKGNYS